jgi:hypothetical protein
VDHRLPFMVSGRPWPELSEKDRDFFCDDDYLPLSPNHAAQIALLAPGDNVRLASWALDALPPGWPDGAEQRFASEELLRIHECWNDPAGGDKVRRWLFDRGIPFRRTVYLIYAQDRVVQTTWRMVVRYWDAFAWSVGYAMVAVDHTLEWACYFHHEDVIVFGSHDKRGRRRKKRGP